MRDILIGIALVVTGTLVMSVNNSGHSIYLLDEAKNASCAREMMEQGEWIVPTFNYQLRTDKPPLPYYAMIASYQLFGVNPFAARLGSAICGGLVLLVTFYFTRIYLGDRTAVLTVLVLLSSIGFLLQFRLAVPDPYLILFLTTTLFSLYHGLEQGSRGWLLFAAVTMGLAFLAKGPVGILLPVIIAGLYLVFFDHVKWSWSIVAIGAGLVMLVVFPWYLLVGVATDGEWLRGFFLEHNVDRFLNTREGHSGHLLLLPLVFIGMTLPGGAFIIPAIGGALKRPFNPLLIFSLLVIAVVVAFFSLSATKLPNYVSPGLPFMALIIAKFLGDQRWRKRLVFWPLLLLMMMITAILLFSDEVTPYLEKSDLGLLWIMPAGMALASGLIWKGNSTGALVSMSLALVLTMALLFASVVPRIDRMNPVYKTSGLIDPSEEFVSYHIFNPAFSFLIQKEVPVLVDRRELDQYISRKGPVVVITRSNVLDSLKGMNLDTLIVVDNLFETSQTAVLRSKNTTD